MEKKSIVNRVIRWTPRIIIMIFFGILAWNEIVPKGKGDNLLFGVGFVALCYSLASIIVWFLCPIKRDWILVRGRFFVRVLIFVVSVPIAFTAHTYD